MDPATIAIIEGAVLDAIAWFRKRHAETGELPTNEEVVARVKAKLAAGNLEGDDWNRDNPETPT